MRLHAEMITQPDDGLCFGIVFSNVEDCIGFNIYFHHHLIHAGIEYKSNN